MCVHLPNAGKQGIKNKATLTWEVTLWFGLFSQNKCPLAQSEF